MMHLIRKCRDEEAGSATIELAIIAPVLAALIVGVVDLSMAYSRKLEIEQGAQRAIEKVMQTTTTETVDATLEAEAASAAAVPEDHVSVKYLLECDGEENDITTIVDAIKDQIEGGTPPDQVDTTGMNCAAGEKQRSYLTVTIVEEYEPVIDPSVVGIKTNENGNFNITVETGIRTQ